MDCRGIVAAGASERVEESNPLNVFWAAEERRGALRAIEIVNQHPPARERWDTRPLPTLQVRAAPPLRARRGKNVFGRIYFGFILAKNCDVERRGG